MYFVALELLSHSVQVLEDRKGVMLEAGLRRSNHF